MLWYFCCLFLTVFSTRIVLFEKLNWDNSNIFLNGKSVFNAVTQGWAFVYSLKYARESNFYASNKQSCNLHIWKYDNKFLQINKIWNKKKKVDLNEQIVTLGHFLHDCGSTGYVQLYIYLLLMYLHHSMQFESNLHCSTLKLNKALNEKYWPCPLLHMSFI